MNNLAAELLEHFMTRTNAARVISAIVAGAGLAGNYLSRDLNREVPDADVVVDTAALSFGSTLDHAQFQRMHRQPKTLERMLGRDIRRMDKVVPAARQGIILSNEVRQEVKRHTDWMELERAELDDLRRTTSLAEQYGAAIRKLGNIRGLYITVCKGAYSVENKVNGDLNAAITKVRSIDLSKKGINKAHKDRYTFTKSLLYARESGELTVLVSADIDHGVLFEMIYRSPRFYRSIGFPLPDNFGVCLLRNSGQVCLYTSHTVSRRVPFLEIQAPCQG